MASELYKIRVYRYNPFVEGNYELKMEYLVSKPNKSSLVAHCRKHEDILNVSSPDRYKVVYYDLLRQPIQLVCPF